MKPKIAIVGAGRWGKNLIKEFEVLADVAKIIRRDNSATDYPAVLADQTVTAVVVATPIDTHFAIAKQALEAGKHVFLEKPGTASETELAELISLAESKKLGLQIGYIFLYHDIFKYLAKEIKTPIKSICCSWEKFGSFGENILLNLACHELAIAHDLLKQSPTSQGHLYNLPAISAGDLAGITIEYPNETKLVININRISTNKQKTVTIDDGRALWRWQNDQLWLSTDGQPYELIYEAKVSALANECAAFIEMITTNPKILHGDTALSVHHTLDQLLGR